MAPTSHCHTGDTQQHTGLPVLTGCAAALPACCDLTGPRGEKEEEEDGGVAVTPAEAGRSAAEP